MGNLKGALADGESKTAHVATIWVSEFRKDGKSASLCNSLSDLWTEKAGCKLNSTLSFDTPEQSKATELSG